MSFTSLVFLTCILPVFFVLAFFLRSKAYGKQILLGVINGVFYAWAGYKAFLLILAIALITWFLQAIIVRNPKRWLTIAFCVIVAGPLIAAKYTLTTGAFVGISFYTFEAISLLADTYRDEERKGRSIIEVFMYLLFFATVTQGPILRIKCFEEGIKSTTDIEPFNAGVRRFAIGLGKKTLIADKIAPLADYYFNGMAMGNSRSILGLWIGSFAYTLQIYYDFSGYSDMAIGIAKVVGFDIPENFNMPYIASSVKDFWRRWHISLSTWFRNYIYIPLGGNRKGEVRTILNLLAVWLLTGIWHGSDLTFIIWGLGYFVLLVIERYTNWIDRSQVTRVLGHIYTLFFVNLLWVFFRADDMNTALAYTKGMFGINGLDTTETMAVRFIPFMLVAALLCLPFERLKERYTESRFLRIVADLSLIAITGLAVCTTVNSAYTPFIYGKF